MRRPGWSDKKVLSKSWEWRADRIRQSVTVTDLFDRLGVVQGSKFYNGHPQYCCPLHDDNNPSLCVTAKNDKWTCWPCDLKMRDVFDMVHHLYYSDEDKGWFYKSIDHLEKLFGMVEMDAATEARMVVEARQIRERRIAASENSRITGMVLGYSGTARRKLSNQVRKRWGDDLAPHSPYIIALYGHLEHLLARGKPLSNHDDYRAWRSKVQKWLSAADKALAGG